jgi:Bacterial Ig-like domain (group 3)/Calx-beta domain
VAVGGSLTVDISSGAPAAGQTFTIIDNDGTDPVSGTFTGMPERATIPLAGQVIRISYQGGDGNDVVLAVLAETSAVLTQNTSTTKVGEAWTLTDTVSSAFGMPTGSVSFSADGVSLGTASLVNGVASLTVALASAGPHDVVATFLGTGVFADSVSGIVSHVVTHGQTMTMVASDHPNTLYGQTIHFTGTVDVQAPAAGQPTGSVTILADGVPIGIAPLVNGTVTLDTAALHAGAKSITATYSGDANFDGSTSSAIQQNVGKARTAVDARQRTPLFIGEPAFVTVFVSVTPGSTLVPSGAVSVSELGAVLGTQVLAGGAASFSFNPFAVGDHSLVVNYGGDADFEASSETISHVVTHGQTMTMVASDHPNTLYGQTIHFTGTVAVQAPAAGQPTGSVTILADGVPLGIAPLVNGTVTLDTAALHAGAKSITATYSGDANFDGSTASAIQQNVGKARTAVDARQRTPLFIGESAFVTVFVSVTPDSTLVPSGAVSVSELGAVLGTQVLAGGAASFSFNPFAVGDHSLVVNYGGAADFEASSETIIQSVVVPAISIHGARVLEGNRGVTSVSLVATLSAPVSQTVRVSFSTVAGSATAGEDYESASGVIEFAPGELTHAIEIHVIGDTFPESDETFSVLLSDPDNATIDTPSAMIVIVNDDQVPPRRRPSRH